MRVRRSGFLPAPWLAVAALVCQSQAAASVEISVQRLENESIVARYVFDREITAFRFLVAEDVSRDQWQVDEASLTFAGNVVSSIGGAPFTTAMLTLPSAEEFPRSSPTAMPTSISMGASSTIVDLTHLRVREAADGATFVLHNAFDEGAGACAARRTIRLEPDELASAARRYAFLSTTAEVCRSAGGDGEVAIVSADAPAALRQLIADDFARRYDSLRLRVGERSPKLTLFVAHKGRKNASITRVLRGVNGVVVAPLEGVSWSAPTSISRESLISTLLGSVVAGWLGGPDGASSTSSPNWLAGGAATYAAILDGIEHGRAEDTRVKARIDFVDVCARRVTSTLREPSEGPPIMRNASDCGLLVQLVYDAITRAESASERTIYDLWAEALATAGSRDGVDPAAFLATNPRAGAALAGLLHGPEADLASIVSALRAAGVDAVLGESPDPGGAALKLLMPFLSKACPGARFGFGFAGRDTGIGFDVNVRQPCDRLPAKFSFIRIEALSIYSPPRQMYDAVEQACAADGAITLTGTTAALPVLELDCPEEIPSVPSALKIRDLGVLLR